MNHIGKEHHVRILFIATLLLLIYLSYLIVRPFFTLLIVGALIAYIFHPVYRLINKYLKRPTLSALLLSLLLFLTATVPAILAIGRITRETRFFYLRAKQIIISGNILGIPCTEPGAVCGTLNRLRAILTDPQVLIYLENAVQKGTDAFIAKLSNVLISLPKYALALFITFFITFYLFTDGDKLVNQIKKTIPLTKKLKDKIFKDIRDIIYAVIYGTVLIALLQGGLAMLGYFIFGVNSPILWGLVTTLFAFVPFIGTAFVWVPLALGLILKGNTTGNAELLWRGVGLAAYSAIIVSSADNLLKPKIVGSKAGMHPVLVLLGVLGGLIVFGTMGFVIGPIVIALLFTFLRAYQQRIRT